MIIIENISCEQDKSCPIKIILMINGQKYGVGSFGKLEYDFRNYGCNGICFNRYRWKKSQFRKQMTEEDFNKVCDLIEASITERCCYRCE